MPIVLVSGLPRSGTSLMMQLLTAGGLPPLSDQIRTADEDNPRGYFELESVKAGLDWLDRASGHVVKLISALLIELPEDRGPYRVVFMRRRLDEVLASQKKMLARRGESLGSEDDDEAMKSRFAGHVEEVEAWMRGRADVETLFVSYNRLVAEPAAQIARVNDFVGGNLDLEAAQRAVDPSLYRNRGESGR